MEIFCIEDHIPVQVSGHSSKGNQTQCVRSFFSVYCIRTYVLFAGISGIMQRVFRNAGTFPEFSVGQGS